MPDYGKYTTIQVVKQDRVAQVILNRPEALNAVDRVMHRELENLWLELAEDGEVNAIVLTGAGRAFSAGGDLRGMKARLESPAENFAHIRRIQRGALALVENMLEVEQPIIAAVNGAATGLGVTIALLCDIIIASEQARFGDTHVRAGLAAGDGGAAIWPLLVGIHRAKEFLMTGDIISAREAERIGLVNKVVPHEELMPTSLALAQRLAQGPIWAIKWTKVSLNKWLKFATNMVVPTSLALEGHTMATEDHLEAVNAFLEKRQPQFRGQ